MGFEPAVKDAVLRADGQLEIMPVVEFLDLREEGPLGLIGPVEHQIVEQGRPVGFRLSAEHGQNGRDLGSEQEAILIEAVVKGLDAVAVARAEQRALLPVVDDQGPHAVEAMQHAFAPFLIGGQQNFAIGLGPKAVSLGCQFFAQLDVVEDLAVEDHHVALVVREHGLMPRSAQVDDAQAHKPEPEATVGEGTLVVWAAMLDLPHHGGELGFANLLLVEVNNAGYAAHIE